MASKLISGTEAAEAPPFVWRGAVSPPTPSQPKAQNRNTSAPANQPKEDDQEPLQVIAALQARQQELERELESRPKHAYQRGFDEGQAAGMQQANARLEPVLAKFAISIKDLATLRKRHLLEAEEDAVRLAVAVARRVLHRELSVDPESLLGVVKAAFERVDARDVHRVRLNPQDVPALEKRLAAGGLPPRIEIVADPGLERGGVIVETNRGSIDASVSSQLKEIESGLVDLVRRAS